MKFPSVQFQLWLSHQGPSLLPFGILTLCYGKSPVMNGQILLAMAWQAVTNLLFGAQQGGLDRHDTQLCNPTCFDEFWMENLWHGAVGRYSKSISNFFPGRMVPRLKRGTSETATVSHPQETSPDRSWQCQKLGVADKYDLNICAKTNACLCLCIDVSI